MSRRGASAQCPQSSPVSKERQSGSLNSTAKLSTSFLCSSRRRHTRSLCDWSSDVCSSDLWDIEAHLTDIKNHDFSLKTGVRRAGQPVHSMWVRISIDRHMNIVDASASSDAVPYAGGCETIAPAYRKLIGMNLMKRFRNAAHEILCAVMAC